MHSDPVLSPPIIVNHKYIRDELIDQLQLLEGKQKELLRARECSI